MKPKYYSILEVAYNTGRLYTEHGQRIAVFSLTRFNGDGTVDKCLLMIDFDRAIDYRLAFAEFPDYKDLIKYVQFLYDYDRGMVHDSGFWEYSRDLLKSTEPGTFPDVVISRDVPDAWWEIPGDVAPKRFTNHAAG